LFEAKKARDSFKNKLNILRAVEEDKSRQLEELKKVLEQNKETIERKSNEATNSKEEIRKLTEQLANLQTSKTATENNRITPERQRKLLQEQECLQNELRSERKKRQESVAKLEEIQTQELSETLQTRLQAREEDLKNLKVEINGKLTTDSQKDALETLLEMNEQRSSLVTLEGVIQTLLLPVERQLKRAKDKLVEKVGKEEIEDFCRIQAEIIKLKIQLEDFQKKEKQFEAYTSILPKQ